MANNHDGDAKADLKEAADVTGTDHYATVGKQASAILDDKQEHVVVPPLIEVDNSSMEGLDEVVPISIDKELFQRLLKVKVISDLEFSQSLEEVEASTEKKWPLSKYLTV